MKRQLISREECKAIQMELLRVVVEICEMDQLDYSLAYGTLLGAVRHKGFIPWDDDIDIYLFREQYDRLIDILKKQEKYNWMSVLDESVDGYYYPFAKIVDSRTCAKMEDNLTNHGVWIDIFPLDYLPENKKELSRFIRRCKMLRAITIAMTTDFQHGKLGKKYFPKKILSLFAIAVGKKKISSYYRKMITKYENDKGRYIGCLSSPYIVREQMEIERVKPKGTLEFEGAYFKVPKDWDYYLSTIYGNYMELPPESKRRVHSITAWKI